MCSLKTLYVRFLKKNFFEHFSSTRIQTVWIFSDTETPTLNVCKHLMFKILLNRVFWHISEHFMLKFDWTCRHGNAESKCVVCLINKQRKKKNHRRILICSRFLFCYVFFFLSLLKKIEIIIWTGTRISGNSCIKMLLFIKHCCSGCMVT